MTNPLLLLALCAPCDPACDPQVAIATTHPTRVVCVAQDGSVSTLSAAGGFTLAQAVDPHLALARASAQQGETERVLAFAQRAHAEALAQAETGQRELLARLRAQQAAQGLDPRAREELERALERTRREIEDAEVEIAELPTLAQVFERKAQEEKAAARSLEERVRTLERVAREEGHHVDTSKSIEERVAALERALRVSSTEPAPAAEPKRAPSQRPAQVWVFEDGDQEVAVVPPPEAPRARKRLVPSTVKSYRMEGDELVEVPTDLDAFRERGLVFEGDEEPAPAPAARDPRRARVWTLENGRLRAREEAAPAPAVPPAPAAPPVPAPGAPEAPRMRLGRVAPLAPTAPAPTRDAERQRLEETVRALRAEAEALREDMRRMRAEIERLPRR